MASFEPFNFSPAAGSPPDVTSPTFSILAPPKSDIYVQPVPPATFDYNAPAVLRRIPKSSFVSAHLTITAPWHHLFDQGGLLFAVPTKANPRPDGSNATTRASQPAWIKAGIEVSDGYPCVSVVARSPGGGWADWSLLPLWDAAITTAPVSQSVTLHFERYKNALKIFYLRGDEKVLVRKVPWVFLDDESGQLGDDVQVGVFAAQPDPSGESGGKSLEVTFSGFEIKTTED